MNLNNTKIYVDRIENDKIVCWCDKVTFDLPLSIIPDATEGDVYTLNKFEDDTTAKNVENLINKLFE